MKLAQALSSPTLLALAAAALCATAVLGCTPPAARSANAPSPDAPGTLAAIAHARAAAGGARWDAVTTIETTGTLTVGELTGSAEQLEDVRTGRYRSTLHVGAMVMGDGFDGTASWDQAVGGEVVALDSAETVVRAVTTRWLTARGYFRGDGARYRDLGPKTLGARQLHAVEATPAGGAPIELWFDDATGLLAQTTYRESSHLVVDSYDDYRAVNGVQLAFRVVSDPGDPRNRSTFTVGEVKVRTTAAPAHVFDRPTTDAERLSFVHGASATQLAFELINNHIYIHASVDGQPVRMLVDTGGLNMLTPQAAARLGLTSTGRMAAQGAGERQVDLSFARGRELAVGDVRLADPVFYVIDVEALGDVEGEAFDGLVGFELFHRLAARIDYPGHTLTLTRPDAFMPPTGAPGHVIAVPFELRDRIPIAPGAIDGIPTRFTIDTGARNSITANGPFVRDHQLEARYHAAFETVVGWGVGGGARGKPVRFSQVKLGDAVIDDVVGDLFTGSKGADADPDTSANLGGGILKRFVVTFDYRARRMYLEPVAGVARDIYDRAGMFFMDAEPPGAADQALRVAAVTPGGAAARAGLVADDQIVAIDGAEIATRPLWAWRAMLAEGKVGARHTLSVMTRGARRDVTLVLMELVP